MAVRVEGFPRARFQIRVFVPVLVLVLVLLSCTSTTADPTSDALLKFKSSLSNSDALASWDPKAAPPCIGDTSEWAGVLCSAGHVRGLRLENMGLKGSGAGPAINALAHLPRLRSLSLMNNTLTGPAPDLRPLRRLRSAYLSYNHFSGEIFDDGFAGMRFLKKVMLSDNELGGTLPSSLVTLPRLEVFMADQNKFYGKIPDFGQKSLTRINVSNNDLEGPIPEGLAKMDSSSFSGNKNLCGLPLRPCSGSTTNIFLYTTSLHEKYSQLLKKILIFLIALLIVAVLVASLIITRSRRKTVEVVLGRTSVPKDKKSSNNALAAGIDNADENQNLRKSGGGELGKLIFLKDERRRFELLDLLQASAEVLGSGTFGASYKTTVDSDLLVVKRYKEMNGIGREEFHEHMRRLGGLKHPNLLPLVAYCYTREEKLLVYDYVRNGSLAFHLHGSHSVDEPALDWPTRLKIIKGVSNGLSYLHKALPCLAVPHGHLKSSNIILNEALEPLMTDYALLPAINPEHAQRLMIAYKSPEHASLGRISRKADVWSLGILILELLTGRYPENYHTRSHDPEADLAVWVNGMIKERRTGKAFDPDMDGAALRTSRGEMLKLLKIGLSCCDEDLERRLDLAEAVDKIEELSNMGSREFSSLTGDFYSCVDNIVGDQEYR